MSFLRKYKSAVLVLCVFVVTLRLLGAHAHLCFDGREPPVTLHITDAIDAHHADEASSGLSASHDDLDVGVASDLLLKRIEASFDMVVLFTAFFLLLAFMPASRHAPVRRDDPPPAPAAALPHFRPPLRAPPRHTSLFV